MPLRPPPTVASTCLPSTGRLPPVFPNRQRPKAIQLPHHRAQGLGHQLQRRTRIQIVGHRRLHHQAVFSPPAKRSPPITAIVAGECFTATTASKAQSKVNSGNIPWSSTAASHSNRTSTTTTSSRSPKTAPGLLPGPLHYRTKLPEQAFKSPGSFYRSAMENSGLVAFTEDYIFVSAAQPRTTSKAAPALSAEVSTCGSGDLVTHEVVGHDLAQGNPSLELHGHPRR